MMMKTQAALVFVSLTMGSAAQAACSTADMAGKWLSTSADFETVMTINAAGAISGTLRIDAGNIETLGGRITLSSACRIAGTWTFRSVGFPLYSVSVRGATEFTGAAASSKPNFLTMHYRTSLGRIRIYEFIRE
jgi:hypothetical protein